LRLSTLLLFYAAHGRNKSMMIICYVAWPKTGPGP